MRCLILITTQRSSVENLLAGVYNLTIIDKLGNTTIESIEIVAPEELNLEVLNNPETQSGNDDDIEIIGTECVAPYT